MTQRIRTVLQEGRAAGASQVLRRRRPGELRRVPPRPPRPADREKRKHGMEGLCAHGPGRVWQDRGRQRVQPVRRVSAQRVYRGHKD